jgi:hypothetical protein
VCIVAFNAFLSRGLLADEELPVLMNQIPVKCAAVLTVLLRFKDGQHGRIYLQVTKGVKKNGCKDWYMD